MLIYIKNLTLTAFVLLAPIVGAQGAPATPASVEGGVVVSKEPGSVGALAITIARGTITNVNSAKRELTIKRPTGGELVVPVGEEVRNFSQIKVGDQVVFRQAQTLVVDLKKTGGRSGIRERSVTESAQIANIGDKPGIAASRETHIVADVTALDRKANTITLRGVRQSRKLHLRDPSILENVSKGDQVEAVLVEGEVLSVEVVTPR